MASVALTPDADWASFAAPNAEFEEVNLPLSPLSQTPQINKSSSSLPSTASSSPHQAQAQQSRVSAP